MGRRHRYAASGADDASVVRMRRRAAMAHGYVVHLYTASSLLFVVLGVQWSLDGQYRAALVAMAITIVIDATDGAWARGARVGEHAARIDGPLLDNVVDFASYAVLPVVFLLHADLLLPPATLFGSLILISSAYAFSRADAKLSERGFFVGFPSYWNVAAFYLYALAGPAWANTLVVLALVGLSFTNLRFLYVSRLGRGRTLHFALAVAWGCVCLAALWTESPPWRTLLLYGSLAYPAFYTAHSFVTGRRGAGTRAV